MSTTAPWPAPNQWSTAIQNPQQSFMDPFLRYATPAVDKLGLPLVSSGNYAYVFKLSNNGTSRAVRCFARFIPDRQSRYELVSRHLDKANAPVIVGFEYEPRGIRVNGVPYPIQIMDWLAGDTLDVYVDRIIRKPNSAAILNWLAEEWAQLVAVLDKAGIAHGDLQHGNVLVCQDSYRLVDLDAMFVPGMERMRALELGHRHYQHPQREAHQFDANMDRFPALVTYVSLKALAAEPSLWSDFHDENLIFTQNDFKDPQKSRAFRRCTAIGGEVGRLATTLAAACIGAPSQTPALSALVPTKHSKLPGWMRNAPAGSVITQPKTREAGAAARSGPTSAPPSPPTERRAPTWASAPQPSPAAQSPTRQPVGPSAPIPPSKSRAARANETFWQSLAKAAWVPVLFALGGDLLGIALGFAVAVSFGLWKAFSESRTGSAARAGTTPPASWTPPARQANPQPTAQPSQRTYQPTTPPQRSTPPRPTPLPPTKRPTPTRTFTTPSSLTRTSPKPAPTRVVASTIRYIYHAPSCEWAVKISTRNRVQFDTPDLARRSGYRACYVCRP